MTNLFLTLVLPLIVIVFSSFWLFGFAVYTKILFIALKTRSKKIIFSIASDKYPISSFWGFLFWDFLYNYSLLAFLVFLSVFIVKVFYSTSPFVFVFMPISFILGLFVKIEWIDEITIPLVNVLWRQFPPAAPGTWQTLYRHAIKWRVKNGITIYYNILQIVMWPLSIIGLVFLFSFK